jgi:hypothetical protein
VKGDASIALECGLSEVKDDNIVKWLKDGSEVDFDSARYIVDTRDFFKLTISPVHAEDEGIYDCAMFNEQKRFLIKSKMRFKLSVQGWLIKQKKKSSSRCSKFMLRNQAT